MSQVSESVSDSPEALLTGLLIRPLCVRVIGRVRECQRRWDTAVPHPGAGGGDQVPMKARVAFETDTPSVPVALGSITTAWFQ